jgi:trimethylamine--corrinoid protein Co-methyltransferase
LARLARVVDNLKNVYAVTGTSMSDVAALDRDFIGFRVMAQNTKKHIRPLMFTKTGVQPIMEMARVLLDNRKFEEYPIFSLGYSILSPFHWAEIPVSMWYLSSGYKIPVMINGEPIAGATSPMTLAGSVAQSNAEILSGIIINQIIEPGRPCIYNLGFAHALDMKTTLCLSGSPECALMAAAGAHMARFYNLPSASWMSTDSIYGTYQAAAEKMMTGLVHAQQGINLIWGVGQLESQKTLSLMQCVLDNDLAGYVSHFTRGFETNEDTIALDEILKQDYEGKYIESDHTFNHFKDTLYFPETFTREYYNAKADSKAQNADDIAREKVNHILKEDPPVYLRTDQERELLRIENAWMQRAAA